MHMDHRLRRLTARFLAISLLAATLFTVDSLAAPSPAEARCIGEGNPAYSWFRYDRAAVQASETPGAGTCDGSNIYTGQLKDEASDGYCVSVWFQETGTGGWVPPDSGAIVVCGNGNKATIQWRDKNGNSYVYEQFCVHRASDLVAVACGWGDRWARPSQYGGPYGVNHGF
jgi:hypothetical protein